MCRCNLKCISDPGGHAMCRMRTFGQVLGPPIRQERLPTLTLMVHSLPVLELLVAAVQPLLILLLHKLCCQLQQVHRCKRAAVLPQAGCCGCMQGSCEISKCSEGRTRLFLQKDGQPSKTSPRAARSKARSPPPPPLLRSRLSLRPLRSRDGRRTSMTLLLSFFTRSSSFYRKRESSCSRGSPAKRSRSGIADSTSPLTTFFFCFLVWKVVNGSAAQRGSAELK